MVLLKANHSGGNGSLIGVWLYVLYISIDIEYVLLNFTFLYSILFLDAYIYIH